MSGDSDSVYSEGQRHGYDPDNLTDWYLKNQRDAATADPPVEENSTKYNHREMIVNYCYVYGKDFLKVLAISAVILFTLFLIGLGMREKTKDDVTVDFGGANCEELEYMASNPGSDWMADQIAKEMERLDCR